MITLTDPTRSRPQRSSERTMSFSEIGKDQLTMRAAGKRRIDSSQPTRRNPDASAASAKAPRAPVQ